MTVKTPAKARGPYDHLIATAALEASPDCIKVIGLDGRLKHMNRAGCAALGVDQHKVCGIDWIGLLPRQVQDIGFNSLHNATLGEHVRFAGLSEGRGQSLRQWDNMLTPLQGASGGVENILCISRDVTGQPMPSHEAACPPNSRSMIGELDRLAGRASLEPPQLDHEPLSFRERECLFWAGLGKTAWETSVILDRSRRTVEFHLANAVRKLRAVNKYHAAMIAVSSGML